MRGNGYSSTVTFQWKNDRQVQLNGHFDMTPTSLETELTVSTPFREYRNLKFATELSYEPNDYRSLVTVQWENKQVQVNGHYQMSSSNLNTELTVTTPFRNYEKFRFAADFGLKPNDFTAEITTQWPQEQQVVLNGIFKITESQIETELTLTTSFRDYDRYKMAALIQYNPNEYHVTLQFDYPYNGYEGRGSFYFNFVNKEHKELSFAATTPFFPSFELSTTYDFVQNQNSHIILAGMTYGKQVTQLTLELNPNHFNLKLVRPLKNLLQLNAEYSMHGFNYDTTLTLTSSALRGPVQLTATLAELKDLTVTFSSPFRGYESLKFTSTYDLMEEQFTSNIAFTYNRNTINLGSQIVFERKRSAVSVTFTSPIPNMEYLMLASEMTKKRDDYKGEFVFQWDRQNKVLINGAISNINTFPKNFLLDIKTPFAGFETQQFSGSLEEIGNGYNVALTAEYGRRQRVSYIGSYALDIHRGSLITNSRLSMSPNTFINFKLELTHSQTGKSSYRYSQSGSFVNTMVAELTSSCPSYPFLKYEHNYAYTLNSKLSSVHKFFWNQRESIDVTYDITVLNDDTYMGKLGLETPFRGYESFNLVTKTKYSANRMSQEATFQWPQNQQVTTTVLYDYTDALYTFNVVTATTFRNFRQFAFLTTCKPFHYGNDHGSSIAIEHNGEKLFDLKLKFTDSSDSRTTRTSGDIQLRNPVLPVSVVYAVAVNDRDVDLFGEFDWNLDNPNSKVSGHIRSTDRSYKGTLNQQFSIETTHPYRTMFFNYRLEKTSARFNNEILFSWKRDAQMGYTITLEDSSTRTKSIYDGKVSLSHPLRSAEFNLHHEKAARQMTTAFEFKWDMLRADTQKARMILEMLDNSRGESLHQKVKVTFEHPALRKVSCHFIITSMLLLLI